MADHHDDHSHDDHDHRPIFWRVAFGLLVLTAMSFAVGNMEATMSRPLVGWSLMMAISCAKALLVISFFMHLRWEANWKFVLTIPASIMSIFLVLMLVPDIGRRGSVASEERERHAARVTAEDEAGEEEKAEAGGAAHP